MSDLLSKAPDGLKRLTKLALARGFEWSGLNWALHRVQVTTLSPFIRVVNYHDVPPSLAESFERQLVFYRKRFTPVGRPELEALVAGRWRADKPGIVLTFDDGLRSHAAVAAPLLEKHGFTGWFFVPVAFVDTPRPDQPAYGDAHLISWSRAPGDDLGAMSWDDVRRLDRRHVIGCHTHTHVRLSDRLPPEQLDLEIRQSKLRLERELDREVDVFCWVGWEESAHSEAAAKAVRDAGYRLAFLNAKSVIRPGTDPLQLHRTCVEAPFPVWFVRYVLSGFFDVLYAGKRKRVNRLTAVGSTPRG